MKANFAQPWTRSILFAYGIGAGFIGILFQIGGGRFETDMVILPITFSLGIITLSASLDERERQLWFIALGIAFLVLFSTLVALIGVLEICRWVNIDDEATRFLDAHWLGLVVALMMVSLGGAGLWVFKETP